MSDSTTDVLDVTYEGIAGLYDTPILPAQFQLSMVLLVFYSALLVLFIVFTRFDTKIQFLVRPWRLLAMGMKKFPARPSRLN